MTPDQRHPKRDFMQVARDIVEQATNEEPDDEESDEGDSPKVKRARKAGKAGGKARAEKLTPERRREIAKKAAEKRWKRT